MATVLLIDDDESLRTVAGDVLRCAGHTVVEARNGKEGLKLFEHVGADLVITDIVMPEAEGLEVLMTLRNKQPPVRIIAMSGGGTQSAKEYLHIAELMGAAKTLAKPFSNEALLTLIDDLLAEPVSPALP